MKKLALTATAALLAVPALAQAKGGVIWDRSPDNAKTGEKIGFTVMAMPDGPSGPGRFSGRHPLVTFRSKSGRVVRVRASAVDRNGVSYGEAAFPDKGPWSSQTSLGGVYRTSAHDSEPFRVGVGLTQTIPAADASKPKATPTPDDGGFPWVWVLSFGSIGSALLVFAMRRRGRWGAA